MANNTDSSAQAQEALAAVKRLHDGILSTQSCLQKLEAATKVVSKTQGQMVQKIDLLCKIFAQWTAIDQNGAEGSPQLTASPQPLGSLASFRFHGAPKLTLTTNSNP